MLGHREGFRGVTTIEGRQVNYTKCMDCGQVIFENEPNPYINMACNSRLNSHEEKRRELQNQ